MSQKIKDGVVLDSTVYVIDEKSGQIPQYMRLVQLFAVIIGCHSVISIFINCFSLDVSKTLIMAAVFFISIVLFLLVWYPLHDFIKIISTAVLYLLILFRWIGKLKNGFYLLENAVIERASSYYGFIGMRFMADYTAAGKDMAFLLIMVLIPVIAAVTIAVIRNKLVCLCYILLLLPVASSFAFGVTPPEIYLIAYIVDMLFLARSCGLWKYTKYKNQKTIIQSVNLKSAIVISIIALTLFLLMKLFIPAYKYEKVTKIKETKAKIQTFMYNFSIEDAARKLEDSRWKIFKSGSKAAGGLSDGKLGRVDEVKYKNEEHLRITVPETSISEGIYLKGYVGSVYTGDSWEGPTLEMRDNYKKLQAKLTGGDFQPVNQNAVFFHRISMLNDDAADLDRPGSITQQCKYYFNKGNIKIKYYKGDKKHIYAPYFTDYEASNAADYKWDLYAEPKTPKASYEFEYYYNFFKGDGLSDYLKPFDTKLGIYAANEKLYRKYVYQTYTKLPQKGLERLKADFSKSNVGAKASSVQGAISYIKDYLDNNTQYTLSPGKLPSGKDFAEYFLYESRRGYCTHYATAGVLMLRAMGIPARYVEGYAVNSSDIMTENSTDKQVNTSYSDQDNYEYFENQVKVSVRDYNAHAWAEVYIDGCGWYPVEFTPGSVVDRNVAVNEAEDIGKGITGDAEATLTPAPSGTITPSKAPDKSVNDKQQNNTPSDKEGTGSGSGLHGQSGMKGIMKKSGWLLLIIIPAIPAAVLFGWHLYLKHRWRKALRAFSPNKRALMIYKEIEKLLSSSRALPKKDKCLEDHTDYAKEHCPYVKEDALASCMETVQKARFGKNSISYSELKMVQRFYNYLKLKIYRNSSLLKKLYLKIILVM